MPITDLTGTKWLLNEQPENFWGDPYSISFTSNNENFVALFADPDDLYGSGRGLKYFVTTPQTGSSNNFVHAYNSRTNVWLNQAYRTISITGGTDATNANLIAWLQANATQIEDEPSNTFSFGNLSIENVYFGSQQVKKVYMGNALVWEKEETANLISFTIEGTSYQAEEGMTWQEWCASTYNTDQGFKVSGVAITNASETNRVVTYKVSGSSTIAIIVTPSDTISANDTYNLQACSGGGD